MTGVRSMTCNGNSNAFGTFLRSLQHVCPPTIMDRIIEISSVFVDLFNSSAGSPDAADEPTDLPIPVQLQEITEDYIQKILTACCSHQAAGAPGFQSGPAIGSSGLRVNEFKPSEFPL